MDDFDNIGTLVTPAPAQKNGMLGSRGGRGTAARDKAALAQEGKMRGALAVERQLRDLSTYYDRDFRGVGPGSVLEYFPTPTRKRFDAAANGMRPLLKPLIRGPGEGTFTDADQALLDSMIPQGGRQDADNEQRFRNIRGLVSDARRDSGVEKPLSPTIKRIR